MLSKSAKRTVYIILFTFLGILLSFLAHMLIEIWYIGLLLDNFAKYGLGLPWSAWYLIHYVGTIILLVAGALFGFGQGKYWWEMLYVKKLRQPVRFFDNLEDKLFLK